MYIPFFFWGGGPPKASVFFWLSFKTQRLQKHKHPGVEVDVGHCDLSPGASEAECPAQSEQEILWF